MSTDKTAINGVFRVTGYVVIETRKRRHRHRRGKRHICGRPGLPSYVVHFGVDTHNTIAFLRRVLTLFFVFPSLIFIYVWESENSATPIQNSKLPRFFPSEEVYMFIGIQYLNYSIEFFFFRKPDAVVSCYQQTKNMCFFQRCRRLLYTVYYSHCIQSLGRYLSPIVTVHFTDI